MSTSRLAAVIAVIAGVRAGICMTADPTWIVEVCAASQASTVGLSEPYASAAQTTSNPSVLGVLGQPELIARVVGADEITRD